MKTKLIFFYSLLFLLSFTFNKSFSQPMAPPPPVENGTFDMIVGEHVSEPSEMMGMKWTSEVKHYWKHNHQFFAVEYSNKAENGMTFTGSGIMTVDKEGNVKGWFFDDFGANAMMTCTGIAEGKNVKLTFTNAMVTMVREVEINGDVLNMKWSMNMKTPDGKEKTDSGTIVYNRKK